MHQGARQNLNTMNGVAMLACDRQGVQHALNPLKRQAFLGINDPCTAPLRIRRGRGFGLPRSIFLGHFDAGIPMTPY
jgi:hypothetical protein